MCGIAGVYALGDRPPDPEWGPLLSGALAHRGPDGEGVYADHRVVLAHRRLAIIDLGEGGSQPMRSLDGRHVIVQNGEIYNFRDVRTDMQREGVAFRTESDTEVLIERLARHGVEGLEALRAMFAFGWYDRDSGDLVVARDRLGKKPVLYAVTREYFAFASEARALLKLPFVRARVDRRALPLYLELLYVPAPHTLIDGVQKLPPGAALRVRAGMPAEVGSPERYWRPPGSDPDQRADRAWRLTFERELLEATRMRTVSDVPIGVFLSGGVDSNAVLECLHRTGHRPVRAFTIGFEGQPDERLLAREGAKGRVDDHVEIVVKPRLDETIPCVLRQFGEPLGDSAVVNNALIAREAARHVKVILNGDGGDELFGGYGRYPAARRIDTAMRFPGGLSLLKRRYAGDRRLLDVCDAAERGAPVTGARLLSSYLNDGRTWLADEWPEAYELPVRVAGQEGLAGAMFAWDTALYLPDDLLVKVDVASMAYGLENRSPFLDHRVFEHVARLPASRRAGIGRTKPLLKRLMRGRIPDTVRRAPKRGFELPLDAWFRGPLHGWLGGLVGDPQASGRWFAPGTHARLLEGFEQRTAGSLAPYQLWNLAALEFWAREFNVKDGR